MDFYLHRNNYIQYIAVFSHKKDYRVTQAVKVKSSKLTAKNF